MRYSLALLIVASVPPMLVHRSSIHPVVAPPRATPELYHHSERAHALCPFALLRGPLLVDFGTSYTLVVAGFRA